MILSLAQDSGIKNLLDFVLRAKGKTIEITICDDKRTSRQLRSIWLYCSLLATDLNDAGLDIKLLLKEDLEVNWNKTLVMDLYFRTIQKALFNTDSTKDLKKSQVSEIYEEMNRHLSKFGIATQFPNYDYNDKEYK